jgi:hypothetical protein
MIGLPAGTRVWLVAGHADLRKGFDGLAAIVQTTLAANPFCGQVFAFRGRRGDILKVLWFDGQGCCCLPTARSVAASCGRRRTAAAWRSLPRSCRCCSKALIGGCRFAPMRLGWRRERLYNVTSGADLICASAPSPDGHLDSSSYGHLKLLHLDPSEVDKSPAHRASLWTAPAGYVTCPLLLDACLRPDALRLPNSHLKKDTESENLRHAGRGSRTRPQVEEFEVAIRGTELAQYRCAWPQRHLQRDARRRRGSQAAPAGQRGRARSAQAHGGEADASRPERQALARSATSTHGLEAL